MKKRKLLFTCLLTLVFSSSCSATFDDISKNWPSVSVDSDGTWIIDGKDSNVSSNGYNFEDIKSIEQTTIDGLDAYVFTFNDGTSVTISLKEDTLNPDDDFKNELTADALDDVSENLELSGHLTRTFSGKLDEDYSLDVQVAYNSDAYYYTSKAKDGTTDEGYIYKRAGRPQICVISLENKKVYEDIQGVPWSDYTNPFIKLKSTDFIRSEDNKNVFNLDLSNDELQEDAISFLTSVTRYSFSGVASLSLTMSEGSIIAFDATTKEAMSFYGKEAYQIHFDVLAKNDKAKEINGPYLYEKKPEHEKLGNALKALCQDGLVYNYKILKRNQDNSNWDDENLLLSQKIFIDDSLYYVEDLLNNVGAGYIIKDNTSYEVTNSGNTFTRTYYPYLINGEPILNFEEYRQDFSIAAPEIFNVIDDKHFELNGSLAGIFGYYSDPYFTDDSYYTTKATIELDESYHVKTITYSDDTNMYVLEFLENGDIVYPFDFDNLKIGIDTLTPFKKTYTYVDKNKINHSIIVSDISNIKVDDKPANNIVFDSNASTLSFQVNDYFYSISLINEEYSLTVRSYVDAYFESFSNDSLLVK